MNQPLSLTRRRIAVAWALGVSTMVTTQVADAQPRWGRPNAPNAGACFYRDLNFRGPYFCARPGEDIPVMSGRMNDQISSIRTFGDTEVTIFQDQRFRGRWTRLEDDVRNLRREGWNDRLSSIRVSSGYGRERGRNRTGRTGSGLGRIESGEWRDDRGDRRDGSGAGRNDAIDRRDGTGAGTGRNDATGRRDGTGVARNDQTGRVDTAVQTDQQRAEEVVARAYRSMLGREPDPASRAFVDKVLRERWTEEDVAREIRNSPEYRSKHR